MAVLRVLGITAFAAVWIGLGVWLSLHAVWPGTCDHEGGRRIVALLKKLQCSPDLLRGGAWEFGLFAFIWSMPAFLIGCIVWRYGVMPARLAGERQ